MSSNREGGTLSKAERLISEYRNTSSTREKVKTIRAFIDLWSLKPVGLEDSDCSEILRGMRHVKLLPLVLESLTSRERVTSEGVELQALMLTVLRIFFQCCVREKLYPPQLEASLPDVFARSFEMIEEQSDEDYVLQLHFGVLTCLGEAINLFDSPMKPSQMIKRIDISKALNTIWASSFAPLSRSLDACDNSSTRHLYLFKSVPSILLALRATIPLWESTYLLASLTRAVARYGSERIGHQIKELCDDPQTSTTQSKIKTVTAILSHLRCNRDIAMEMLKAGVQKSLLTAYWTWVRNVDEKEEIPEVALGNLVFQAIHGTLELPWKTGGEEALLKRTIQNLLDNDFMMVIGRVLLAAQYDESWMERAFRFLRELFYVVFKQLYGPKCEDREFWHSFSHVLNCARAYFRVHGDPPVLRRDAIYGYRAVTHLWHDLGISIGVREDIRWSEFVWGKLPLEARKMGCNWIKCPIFGMDYMITLTAGPTPLVCSKCREVFYCSMECQKQQVLCSNQILSGVIMVRPLLQGLESRDPSTSVFGGEIVCDSLKEDVINASQ